MANSKCPSCNEEVNNRLLKCPSCGVSVKFCSKDSGDTHFEQEVSTVENFGQNEKRSFAFRFIINPYNWVLGSFFLLAGFAGLVTRTNQNIYIPIVIFSIGTLLFPPIRNFIYSKTKKTIPMAIRIILILFLFIFVGVFSKKENDINTEKSKNITNEEKKILENSRDKKIQKPIDDSAFHIVEATKSEPAKASGVYSTGENFLIVLLFLIVILYLISNSIKQKAIKPALVEKKSSQRKICPYCETPMDGGFLYNLLKHSSCRNTRFNKCEICGKKFKQDSRSMKCEECREQYQNKVKGYSEGQEEIFSIICQSILSGESFELLEKKIKEPFELLEIRMVDLKLEYTKEQILIGGWGKAVSFYLEKGLLGDEEENRLLEFQSYFSFTKDQYPWQLKMAIFLKSVLNGMVPEPEWGKQWDFNSYGVFLHQNEILYWCLDGVKYFEDKIHRHFVGNTNSVSIDIMKGVKYNTGGFTSHEVETKEVLKFSGNLVVTDKNICFNGYEENINFKGSKKSIRIPYARIASIRQIEDRIIIVQDSENAKPQVLKLEDDWNKQFTYNLIMHLSQKKL